MYYYQLVTTIQGKNYGWFNISEVFNGHILCDLSVCYPWNRPKIELANKLHNVITKGVRMVGLYKYMLCCCLTCIIITVYNTYTRVSSHGQDATVKLCVVLHVELEQEWDDFKRNGNLQKWIEKKKNWNWITRNGNLIHALRTTSDHFE